MDIFVFNYSTKDFCFMLKSSDMVSDFRELLEEDGFAYRTVDEDTLLYININYDRSVSKSGVLWIYDSHIREYYEPMLLKIKLNEFIDKL